MEPDLHQVDGIEADGARQKGGAPLYENRVATLRGRVMVSENARCFIGVHRPMRSDE